MKFAQICDQLAQGCLVVRNGDDDNNHIALRALLGRWCMALPDPCVGDILLAQGPSEISHDGPVADGKCIMPALHLPGDRANQLIGPV